MEMKTSTCLRPVDESEVFVEGQAGAHSRLVGVWDLDARGYFIPGRASQRGGSGSNVSVSHVVRPGQNWTQVSHL